MNMMKFIAVLLSGVLLMMGCGSGAETKAAQTWPETAKTGAEAAKAGKGVEIQVTEAVYPAPVAEGKNAEAFVMGDGHWEWWQHFRELVRASEERQEGMDAYYTAILQEMLLAEEDANAVCSPLNLYVALSMLAETSDGETRKQILDVLQVDGIEALRERTKALWEANYQDTPLVKSLLADSLWLRNDISYHEETLQRLADLYYASAYCGEMGSKELDQALQEWTDKNTGGLLSEYTRDLKLDARTVLALVSTIYYKAAWNDKFRKDRTETAVFHGAGGDKEVSMMHRDGMLPYYHTEHFQAVSLGLSDSGSMYFFLPEEGVDMKDVVLDPESLTVCRGKGESFSTYPIVHLSVPKFKVMKKTALLESLEKLGITDALDPELADFSPLTEEVDQIWVNAVEHAAMVEIDEEGVTGAAYTELAMAGAGMPQEEVDFVLDRPFYFAVVSPDGSLLFTGIVQTID